MTASAAVQTPIERPSIDLAGVRIFASRDGDRVTGYALFPYPIGARTSVPIAYRNAPGSEISNPQSTPGPFDNRQSTIDNQAQTRLALVEEWRAACQMYPDIAKRMHAERVACGASIRCSPRSLHA